MHQKHGSGTRRAVRDAEAELSTGDGRDEAGERGADAPTERRRLDLNLPQVAGSALAAIAAAVLASRLGVYGTVLGAGVVSVVATCGGSVFQHLFRRTGEQIRVVTVQAKPGGRQVVVRSDRNGAGGATNAADSGASGDLRMPGESPDPGDPYVPVDATRLLRVPTDLNTEYGEATTHGARARTRDRARGRGWKRPLLAAVGVFLLAMAGVTGFELMSGQGPGGGHATTVGSVVRGGGGGSVPEDGPAPTPSSGSPSDGQGQDGGASPDPNASPDAGQGADSGGGGSAGPSRTPATPPSGAGDGARSGDPTPAPSGTSGGGSGTDNSGPSGPDSSGTGATPDSGSGAGSGGDSGAGTANR
ncbi:hypothetical protein [Streptomyces hebeiensis]